MNDRPSADNRDVGRRVFLARMVAAGGASALSACLEREGTSLGGSGSRESGGGDGQLRPNTELPRGQHRWNRFLEDAGPEGLNDFRTPFHHLIVLADTTFKGEPTRSQRDTLERYLRGLEASFEWSHEGLLFQVGYSPYYFERFDPATPEGVDLPRPRPLDESEVPDLRRQDLCIHLASDSASKILAAEEALFGDVESLNGVDFQGDLSDVVERRERLTGFYLFGVEVDGTLKGVFEETTSENLEGVVPNDVKVSADNPLFIGVPRNIGSSDASEDRVTIPQGPFSGGTTIHVETMGVDMKGWYNLDELTRWRRMQKADTTLDVAGGYEEQLDRVRENRTDEHAERYGMVGHAEKLTRAREDGEPILIRREFNTPDLEEPGMHFLTLQREIEDFERARELMYADDLVEDHEAIGPEENNGILEFIDVRSRANYLVPPREHRSFPASNPS